MGNVGRIEIRRKRNCHVRLASLLFAWLTAIVPFGAACEAATRRAASVSLSDVKAAVASAQNGDTIVIPPGTAIWTESLAINKAITIQGQGPAKTVITNDIRGLGSYAKALFNLYDGGGAGPRRVTAIAIRSNRITNRFTDKQGAGVGAYGYGTLKRIDHCRFDDLYAGVMVGNANGVTDHNCYDNCAFAWRHFGHASQNQYAWDHFRPLAFDSVNYFFHEDETMELTGSAAVTDEVDACSYVVRHCKITLREAHGPYSAAQSFPLIDVHGDNAASHQYAALTTLIYENCITINSGAAMSFMQLRGGSALIFNNRIATNGGTGGAGVELREERYEYGVAGVIPPMNPKYRSWPAWQDPQYEDVVHNVHVAGNTYNGVDQGPYKAPYSKKLVVARDPQSHPTANAWTTLPNPLVTPPYPHPLITGKLPQQH